MDAIGRKGELRTQIGEDERLSRTCHSDWTGSRTDAMHHKTLGRRADVAILFEVNMLSFVFAIRNNANHLALQLRYKISYRFQAFIVEHCYINRIS